jgi:DNA-binding NtrC family response regulator
MYSVASHGQDQNSSAGIANSPSGRGQAILVVDDDSHVLRFLTRMLGSMGYDPVYQASSPEEALQVFQEHRNFINLVVSDFVMPETTGDHLALKLKGEKPGIKFLFISGNNPDLLNSAVPLISGENFLQKPFTIRDIQDTVERLAQERAAA